MILIRLSGGLGNQMFQYSIGRYLALKHKTELKYDDGFFEFKNDFNSTKRNFELNIFNTQINKATKNELNLFLKKGRIQKRLESLFPFFERHHILNEKFHPFDPTVLNSKNNTYLNGYWQSEKYFNSVREVLLSDFTLKAQVQDKNQLLSEKCKSNNTLAIHIRRGDYVSKAENKEYHGVCSLDYYYSALELIKSKIHSTPEIYVFSDDEKWVKENFKPEQSYTMVDVNKEKDSYYDLYLMSLCNHNIIANSSFSWWGAWLNSHNNKIVIAPKQWFATTKIDSSQIVPENWIRLCTLK